MSAVVSAIATPMFFRLWQHRSPGRAWAARSAPRLAAAVARAAGATGVAADSSSWRTARVTVTSTCVVVAVVACDAAGARWVVKVPTTGESELALTRQARNLAALHTDDRLAGWNDVVPRPLADGEAEGHRYWLEGALPGTPIGRNVLRRADGRRLLDAAVDLVEELHARTAAPVRLDYARVAAWVDGPAGRLVPACGSRRYGDLLLVRLERLRRELAGALAGDWATGAWVHGDCWPGNVLAERATVTGIVDWDRAEPDQLPLHDLLHLYVLARRMTTGVELGDVVLRALRHGLPEALGVSTERVAAWLGGLPERSAVLLYWLRHVSLFIDSEGHRDNPRWFRGNVERVLLGA
ncbi:MAG TPA: aminoglycoside phosphotransferase family protein [Asanoa sp.]|nr:aminoglycoside phosphotransferase family protein [Asanoa sp.]